MRRQPHYVIARTDSGWHGRLVKNGHVIWWTENYARRAGAVRAADIADPERRWVRVVVDERGAK